MCSHFWQLRRILKRLVFGVSFGRTASTLNLHPLVWDCHLDCLESCGGCGMWVEQALPEMREVADTWLSTKLKDKQRTGTRCRKCMRLYEHDIPSCSSLAIDKTCSPVIRLNDTDNTHF